MEGLNLPINNPPMAEFYQKHAALLEMFPDLNFEAVLGDYGHMSSDALATFIIEHIDEMPKIPKTPKVAAQSPQKRGTKRKATANDGGESDSDENYHSDEEYKGDKLVDKMLSDMVRDVRDLRDETQHIGLGEIIEVKKFLEKKFNLVRADFITMAFRALDGNFLATCFACFFSQNSHIEYVRKLTHQRLSDGFYRKHQRPMAAPRHAKKVELANYPNTIVDTYARYCAMLEVYQKKYPELLESETRLRTHASTVRYHRDEEGLMECLVCFDQVHISRMISCQVSELTGMEEWKFDMDQPTSSSALQRMPTFQSSVMGPSDKQGISFSGTAVDFGPSKAGTSGSNVQPVQEEINKSTEKINNETVVKMPSLEENVNEKDDSIEILANPEDDDIQIVFEQSSPAKLRVIKVEEEDDQQEQEISFSPIEQNDSSLVESSYVEAPKFDEKNPESSGSNEDVPMMEIEKSKSEQNIEENALLMSLGTAPSPNSDNFHSFCRDCIRGQAQAATTDAPLAPGGLGLKCMVSGCAHILRYADIRNIIPKDVRKKLEDRIVEENIGIAHIINLERCHKCNFAMEMDVPAEVNKVFDCFNCKARICRLCERDWDEDHFGLSCEALDKKLNHDRKLRDMERRMNEAVVRKCPRCGLNFVKESGCNKMTCRCGMKMCYICREKNIDYTHFCQHPRDPLKKNKKCELCDKTCLLHEDFTKKDEKELEKIRLESDLPTSSGAIAASSSGPTAPKKVKFADAAPRRGMFDFDNFDIGNLRAHLQDMQRFHEENMRVRTEENRRRLDQLRATREQFHATLERRRAEHEDNFRRFALERFAALADNNNPPEVLPAVNNNPFAAPDPAADDDPEGPRDPRIHRRLGAHRRRRHCYNNVPNIPLDLQQVHVQDFTVPPPATPPQNPMNNPQFCNHGQNQRHLFPASPVLPPYDHNPFTNYPPPPPMQRPYQFDFGTGANANNRYADEHFFFQYPNPNNNNNNNNAQQQQQQHPTAMRGGMCPYSMHQQMRPVDPVEQHDEKIFIKIAEELKGFGFGVGFGGFGAHGNGFRIAQGNNNNAGGGGDGPNPQPNPAPAAGFEVHIRAPAYPGDFGAAFNNPHVPQPPIHPPLACTHMAQQNQPAAAGNQNPTQNANANTTGQPAGNGGNQANAESAEIARIREDLRNLVDWEPNNNQLNEQRRNDTLAPYAGRNRAERLIAVDSDDSDDDDYNPLRPGTSRGRGPTAPRFFGGDTSSSNDDDIDDVLRLFAPGGSQKRKKKKLQRKKK